tara:strand:- start:43 stop:630 length:588 start_codon:yes stop_codon:yes gene_type:complete
MLGLTAEQKRRIRKELQRRAQARAAWKAGGGTSKVSASMKGWAGFGKDKAYKKAQLDYINSLNTSGKKSGGSLTTKQQDKWKKSYKKAAKTGAAKGKAKVAAYISKKGANVKRPDPGGKKTTSKRINPKTGVKKVDIAGNKPAPKPKPKPKVIKAGPKYTAKQKQWYARHMKAGKKSKAFIKKTLDARIKAGKTF